MVAGAEADSARLEARTRRCGASAQLGGAASHLVALSSAVQGSSLPGTAVGGGQAQAGPPLLYLHGCMLTGSCSGDSTSTFGASMARSGASISILVLLKTVNKAFRSGDKLGPIKEDTSIPASIARPNWYKKMHKMRESRVPQRQDAAATTTRCRLPCGDKCLLPSILLLSTAPLRQN